MSVTPLAARRQHAEPARPAANLPPAPPLDPAMIALIDALARAQAAEDHALHVNAFRRD